jgi:hypothetical protein
VFLKLYSLIQGSQIRAAFVLPISVSSLSPLLSPLPRPIENLHQYTLQENNAERSRRGGHCSGDAHDLVTPAGASAASPRTPRSCSLCPQLQHPPLSSFKQSARACKHAPTGTFLSSVTLVTMADRENVERLAAAANLAGLTPLGVSAGVYSLHELVHLLSVSLHLRIVQHSLIVLGPCGSIRIFRYKNGISRS